MIKKPFLKTAVLGGALLALTAQAELPSAEMMANTCTGCHGANGVSNGPATPSIAGISQDYFIENMEGFSNGDIPSTIMGRIAKGYSGEEIALMAGYFAEQAFVPAAQDSDAALAEKGAKLHDKYCEKCHADGGTSAEDDAGILAGQWTPYLTYTLIDYHDGSREMTKKMAKKMKKMREAKGDESINHLLNYYAGQKGATQ